MDRDNFMSQSIAGGISGERILTIDDLRLPPDDDDKLATGVCTRGVELVPPKGYLIGKVTHLEDGAMIVEYVKK